MCRVSFESETKLLKIPFSFTSAKVAKQCEKTPEHLAFVMKTCSRRHDSVRAVTVSHDLLHIYACSKKTSNELSRSIILPAATKEIKYDYIWRTAE